MIKQSLRRKKSESAPLTEDAAVSDGAEAQTLKNDSAENVRRAILLLPDEQRDAVILRYWHDLKLRDIAAVTGVSTATAKSRLRLGMAKLRRLLELEVEGYGY